MPNQLLQKAWLLRFAAYAVKVAAQKCKRARHLVSSGKHNMTVRVAINGFGRIGRNVLRAIVEYNRKDVTVVAMNDVGDVETNVHLLKYDSIHGPFRGEVKVSGDTFDVGFGPIKVLAERDPSKLPWHDLNIDVVMECTGVFSDKEKAIAHLKAGAKKVLVSAPSKGADLTVVYGVNHG